MFYALLYFVEVEQNITVLVFLFGSGFMLVILINGKDYLAMKMKLQVRITRVLMSTYSMEIDKIYDACWFLHEHWKTVLNVFTKSQIFWKLWMLSIWGTNPRTLFPLSRKRVC